jgi:hypothetical protein
MQTTRLTVYFQGKNYLYPLDRNFGLNVVAEENLWSYTELMLVFQAAAQSLH